MLLTGLLALLREVGARLRVWQEAVLPGVMTLTLVWTAALALMLWVPMPGSFRLLLAIMLALLPAAILLHAIMPVPRVWGIEGPWFALGLLALTTLLGLFGRTYAADVLNTLFKTDPQSFPIALGAATAVGAVFGVILILWSLATLIMLFLGPVLLLGWLWRWPGLRAFLKRLFGFFIALVAIGFIKGSLPPLEALAAEGIERVALAADFHTAHRCVREEWPAGVVRVAFIGDAQVLAAVASPRSSSDESGSTVPQSPGTRYLVLGCERTIER